MPSTLHYPDIPIPIPGKTRESVAEGVYWLRFPLPFALDHINLWLLDEGDAWTLVDTGIGLGNIRALWQEAFQNCLEGRPLGRIIVTHYHPDHIGQAAWLSEQFRVPVFMTAGESATAARIHQASSQEFGQRLAGLFSAHGLDGQRAGRLATQGNRYRQLVPDIPATTVPIQDGQMLTIGGREWRVMVGHGHSPEHAALYCRQLQVLISGDQVLPAITTNISVGPADPLGDPLAAYLASLATLAELPPSVRVLPSHGLVFEGLQARIEQLQAHHRERLQALQRACHEPRSAADVLDLLFARALDNHQLMFAMGEAIAHLHRLDAAGTIARIRDSGDGIIRFQQPARAV
ncbi:MAG: MBL fold metallo-hydrolase [Gammaproteobacteria bacterium]|nr:MBL fold metallo-hydrolase [Gammaproteobacteria bacterium]MCP5458381.1 MBL fold metallo-hydrolase [Gammaproteobacteria bacterium]